MLADNFVMVLYSPDHTIVVSYEKNFNKLLFSNADYIEEIPFENSNVIANKVLQAMSDNNHATFATEIYGNELSQYELIQCISSWKNQADFHKIHDASLKACIMDSLNCTWLFSAVLANDIKVVDLLICHGADINIEVDNKSPLFYAVQENHIEIIERLLTAKAKISVDTLFIAIDLGRLYVITKLLHTGLDPNTLLKHSTLLSYAVQKQQFDIVTVLLNKGANPNLNVTSDSALHLFTMMILCLRHYY